MAAVTSTSALLGASTSGYKGCPLLLFQLLLHAQIRTAMVTGDHVRTAISVAHQCHILPAGRPVLLVDGPSPAAAGQPSSQGASLSVLYPDGSINSRVSAPTVLAQVGVRSKRATPPKAVGSGCWWGTYQQCVQAE